MVSLGTRNERKMNVFCSYRPSDHEIFRLRDEVQTFEGPDVTFYGKSEGPAFDVWVEKRRPLRLRPGQISWA